MSAARAARMRRAYACVLLALAAPAAAHASPDPGPTCSAEAASVRPATRWAPPLDRSLAFHARDLSLRDALDRLSAAGRIRISYSPELLPLERRVCVSRPAVTLGDALAELLHGTPVEAVVAGADHVVLALRRASRAEAETAAPATELGRTVELDRIVVTGSASGAPRAGLPVALDVIEHAQLEREGTAPLTRVLNAAGAGAWAWEQPPTSMVARYGSIRGASSFGTSAPKVFIDGIEVANPLLAMQIAPEAIERVEVIRGPQGAALYGMDAISGVVNIITRHEGSESGAPRLRVRGGFGSARSDFGSGAAVAQEHALALRMGTRARSAGVDVGVGAVGDYVPGGASRYLLASGNARRVGARSIATATARFYAARAGSGAAPSPGPVASAYDAPAQGQRMHQYTLGGSLKLMPDARWTHTLVAGVDGGRLTGATDEWSPIPTPAEAALRAAEGGADRGTFRVSSVGRFGGGRADLSLTLAAEHSVLREQIPGEDVLISATGVEETVPGAPMTLWTHSTGVVAQGNASLDGRLHLTGGVRVERNTSLSGSGRYAALPVIGAAYVAELGGDATLKLRGAYGKGIRPARTPGREQAWPGAYAQLRGTWLQPEEQSGVEGGFDLAVGRVFSLQVTAFDQLASGLIQRVARPVDGAARHAQFYLQSVGQIANRGLEMQGAAMLGRLSLSGALAMVESRVRRLAEEYGGDLRPGDRMLEVPARTLTLTGAWTDRRWGASLTAYRAFDWINYDRAALARDFESGTRPALQLAGPLLRGYWREYRGVTRLNATASVQMRQRLVLLLAGDNLLDHQRGEPDNLTVVPGRTLSFGIRAEF